MPLAELAEHQSINLLEPVERVARQIEQFTRQQKARLLQLVPDLQTIRPNEAEISPKQLELMAYFQKKLDALPERRARQDDAIFIDDVTVGELFALPEPERARLWDKAHREAEQEIGYYEREVRPDAIPARIHSPTPNQTTLETFRKTDAGEEIVSFDNTQELFDWLERCG